MVYHAVPAVVNLVEYGQSGQFQINICGALYVPAVQYNKNTRVQALYTIIPKLRIIIILKKVSLIRILQKC